MKRLSLGIALLGFACGSDELTCDERVAEAMETVEAVRSENLACSDSTACTLFDPSTSCLGECPRAIASSGLEEVEQAIGEINGSTCENFTADGCAFATPLCVELEARCEEGVCVAVRKEP